MNDTTPIYNLKAVIKETGLSPSTLRAWERRYGLLKPQRSPGGHRLYSRQDIEMLKWLVARQQEGVSISQAMGMWRMQPESAHREAGIHQPYEINTGTDEGVFVELREQWMTACQAFQELAANQVIDQAFAIASPETVSIEIFQKGLVQIGQGWYSGKLSVQQEHFASSIATRRLDALISALPNPTRPETILIACPDGEEHDFILLLCSYLLRRKGWDVVNLGSDVPLEHLDQAIQSTRPVVVLSAAQTLTGAASLSEMSQYLAERGTLLAYGGGIFSRVPDAEQHISGYYLGTDLPGLPVTIERLLLNPPIIPAALQRSTEYRQTLEDFLQHKSAILTKAVSVMELLEIEWQDAGLAGDHLTHMLEAGLRLGDLQLLGFNADWLNGLLQDRGYRISQIRQVYFFYRQAVENELFGQGKLIIDWLENTGAGIS